MTTPFAATIPSLTLASHSETGALAPFHNPSYYQAYGLSSGGTHFCQKRASPAGPNALAGLPIRHSMLAFTGLQYR